MPLFHLYPCHRQETVGLEQFVTSTALLSNKLCGSFEPLAAALASISRPVVASDQVVLFFDSLTGMYNASLTIVLNHLSLTIVESSHVSFGH